MSPYFYLMIMNFALGHAVKSKEIFYNFPVKKMKMTKGECVRQYPDGNKRDYAASIFARFMEIVVDDIIDNNTHFKFPGLGRTQAYMYMKRTEGDKFKRAFKRGKWRDVDFITSNFCGYQLTFEMQSEKRLPRNKPIYLASVDKDRITEHTNNGKTY